METLISFLDLVYNSMLFLLFYSNYQRFTLLKECNQQRMQYLGYAIMTFYGVGVLRRTVAAVWMSCAKPKKRKKVYRTTLHLFCGIDCVIIPAITVPTSIGYYEMVNNCNQLTKD